MKKKISLSTWMIIASILGIIVGLIFKEKTASIKFLGDIFLRLMQMSVVFLVLGAITEAIGNLDIKDIGKIGGKTILTFIVTTLISSFVGLFLSLLIRPGVGVTGVSGAAFEGTLPEGNPLDLIVNFFPRNIFTAMSEGNILQIIVFSVFLGLAISILNKNESGQRLLQLVKDVNVVIMKVVSLVMVYAPIGIFALVAAMTGTSGVDMLVALGKFLIALTVGCLGVLVVMLLIAGAMAKVSPVKLATKLKDTMIVAITTTSSAVSLPVQMEDSEKRVGISRRISRLVNPLGMNLNSHGLAITVAVACITVAQFYNIELNMGNYIMIGIMSTLATFANLAVPGGALVTMAIGFSLTGLPLEGVALIAGVDWFAGIIRTLLNVVDDVLVAVMVAATEKEIDYDIFHNRVTYEEKYGHLVNES